ncbi:sulfite oxidase [Kaistia granuli]|uniref:sulfite oxidase n=1 Tax=Kaistia granuli TaxID=363259 RepID=UPI00035C893E|nr:sulfite oxidase [Kaistia granuli]
MSETEVPDPALTLAPKPLPRGPTEGPLTTEELQLSARNHSMPLEALRYDITPLGLHYLLIHFDIPMIDPAHWRLSIGGQVARPIELTLDEIHARPRVTMPVTLECAGNGRSRLFPRPVSQPWVTEAVGTGLWTGTPLSELLAEAGIAADAVEIVFTGADHGIEKGHELDYARSLSVVEAERPEILLAYEMNGQPLLPQHGFPLRLIVPGWYGMASVKWLTRIEAATTPFKGYYQATNYHYRAGPDDPGTPVQRIRPRALLVPPGYPDFLTRRRTLAAGPCRIEGRAWSGEAPIERVVLGIDGGWQEAVLEPEQGPYAWRRWTSVWEAEPGEHILSCRATDASGQSQPLEPNWNWIGVGNNMVQAVPVTVR